MEMIAMFLLIVVIAPIFLGLALCALMTIVAIGMWLWMVMHPILAIAYYMAALFLVGLFIKRNVNKYYGKGYFINMWREKRHGR